MRRVVAWFLGALLPGCLANASPPVAPEAAPIVSAPVSPAPALRVDPRNLGHLPASPAARAAVDPARFSELAAAIARRYQPHETMLVEHALGLDPGSLASANLASSIGVDPSRTIQVAVASLDPAGRQVIAELRAQMPAGLNFFPGFARKVQKAFSAHRPSPIHIRASVPATDTPRLLEALHTLLVQRRYSRVAAPEGIESLHARRERAVSISLGPQLVIVDILVFEGVVPSPRMIAEAAARTWQTLLSAGSQDPMSTEGHVLRWSYAPEAVADLGFLEALSREQDREALDHDADPDSGMSYTAAAASNLYRISGAEPPRFKSVEVVVGLDGNRPILSTLTELGLALSAGAAAACAPSVSIEFPGALSRFDVSTACMAAVEVPGDTAQKGIILRLGLHQEMRRLDWLDRVTWLGWPLSVPWAPFALARIPLEWHAGVGPRAMQRMERFGWSNPAFGAPDVFWGLLPLDASPESVACAAEEQPDRCKGKRRLKGGGAVQDVGGSFVRLVQLGKRVVLLSSKNRDAVEAMKPVLTAVPVPAMRATVSEGSTRRVMGRIGMQSEGVRYSAGLAVEGSRLVVRAGPAK